MMHRNMNAPVLFLSMYANVEMLVLFIYFSLAFGIYTRSYFIDTRVHISVYVCGIQFFGFQSLNYDMGRVKT